MVIIAEWHTLNKHSDEFISDVQKDIEASYRSVIMSKNLPVKKIKVNPETVDRAAKGLAENAKKNK